MTTYPLPTLACTIDATGIHAPSYADIYASLQASFKAIYGTDAYIDPDSQDGQMLAVFAQAIFDGNMATVAAYNNQSPATAQGVGLSNVVKINGLEREKSSYSTADVNVGGQVGSTITNGIIGDDQNLGTQWALPTSVTIPAGGSVTVTATCTVQGAVSAAPNTLTKILTPQQGWQTVTNPSNASIGTPIETDSKLRQRQSQSTALAAITPMEAVYGQVANLPGVTRVAAYENDGATTDANGIPRNSISLVVEGGDATAIAQAIEQKKAPGCGTFGTTSETVLDPAGVPLTISFFVLGYKQIYAAVTLNPLTGYTTTIGSYVVAAIAQAINGLAIGGTVQWNKLWSPANLSGSAAIAAVSAAMQAAGTLAPGASVSQAQLDAFSETYEITALTIGTAPNPVGTVDIVVLFNEVAQTSAAQIALTT